MILFCPLIKEPCKRDECMAWKNDGCLVFTFFDAYIADSRQEVGSVRVLDEDEDEAKEKAEKATKIADLRSVGVAELGRELFDFAKREFPQDERWISSVSNLFWEEKGIEEWDMPADVKLKIQKAERLAQQQLDEERNAEENATLAKEKSELPKLIDDCLIWARSNNLKRLTHADVNAFLLEKGIEIMSETEHALYSTANVRLKSSA